MEDRFVPGATQAAEHVNNNTSTRTDMGNSEGLEQQA